MDINVKRNLVHWTIFLFGMFSFVLLLFAQLYDGENIFCKLLGNLGEAFTLVACVASLIVEQLDGTFAWIFFAKFGTQALLYWGLGKVISEKLYSTKTEDCPDLNIISYFRKKSMTIKIFFYSGLLFFVLYWAGYHNYLGEKPTLYGIIKFFSIPSYYAYRVTNLVNLYSYSLFWGILWQIGTFIISSIFQVIVYTLLGWGLAKLILPKPSSLSVKHEFSN